MSQDTNIEWTHWPGTVGKTWNPVRGCRRVSPGCENCYAERLAYRFSKPTERSPHPPFEGLVRLGKHGPVWTGEGRFIPDSLDAPLRWRKPATVFVNSMSDLFFEEFTNEQIAAVFGVMAASPQHTFIVLTKRAARMKGWFDWVSQEDIGGTLHNALCVAMLETAREWDSDDEHCHELLNSVSDGWPLQNVVLGVSVEDQKRAEERIPHLINTPAACRMVSYEPALGPIDFEPWLDQYGYDGVEDSYRSMISWLVVGGESGPGARPFDIDWGRRAVEQGRAHGVACFVKQLGAKPVAGLAPTGNFRTHDGKRQFEMRADVVALGDRKGGDPAEWPEDLRVREFPRMPPREVKTIRYSLDSGTQWTGVTTERR